jgi:hypothetical protein
MSFSFKKKLKIWQLRQLAPFYRTYRLGTSVDLVSVDQRGAFSSQHRFFYNRVPKVANSTIVHYLVERLGEARSKSSSYKKVMKTPSAMSRDEVAQLQGCFKFVFFRDPRTRVLSAYMDKVVRRGYLSNGGKIPNSPFRERSDPPCFDEFLDYLEQGGLYDNAHWAPQAALLLLPLEEFDFIGRFEYLKEDLDHVLCKVFGEGLSDELAVKGPPPTGSSGGYQAELSEGQIARIEKIYRQDVEMFLKIGHYHFGRVR